jgi:hypothetical protein
MIDMTPRSDGYRGWLVRWEWAGDHARVKHPIIAVLSLQTGSREVAKFVERYYAAKRYRPDEQLEFMRRPSANPYRAELGTTTVTLRSGVETQVPFSDLIVCGHNPYIVASQVDNLRPSDKEPGLSWSDLPRPTLDLRASQAE